MSEGQNELLQPNDVLISSGAYKVPRPSAPMDLHLDGNEGARPSPELLDLGDDPELLRRYPDKSGLEISLARLRDVAAEQVLVTAGADDAIDRVCRTMLRPGRNIVLPSPSFEMIGRYAALSGAEIRRVSWQNEWPTQAVLNAIDDSTRVIAAVTPNNPTGATIPVNSIRKVAHAAPHALVLVDLAYVEFADEDPTDAVLEHPNVVVTRTLSKAWGLAGLRIGYAIGHPRTIGWMRAAGGPYAVASPSIAIASAALEAGSLATSTFVERVRLERDQLVTQLEFLGARPRPSQANFVLCQPPDPAWLQDGLAGLGIAVRRWPGHRELGKHIRIACPGNESDFERLEHALGTVLAPEAIIFDMDGVMVDVSRSYRAAIIATAAEFGATVSEEDVRDAKAAGDANNDWIVTHRLLAERGVDVPLGRVTEVFERFYQGTENEPGLRETEEPTLDRSFLTGLQKRFKLGIVTGRPRKDAEHFLQRTDLEGIFTAMVCMDEAERPKPSADPVVKCLKLLGVRRAWMLGDTPDDIRAARGADVVPIGVVAPGDDPEHAHQMLQRSGAGRVLTHVTELADIADDGLQTQTDD